MEFLETNITACKILNCGEMINLSADQKIKIIVNDIVILNEKCPNNKNWRGTISIYISETNAV